MMETKNKTVCCLCKSRIPEGVTLVNIIKTINGNMYICKDCNPNQKITVYQIRNEDCQGYLEEDTGKIIKAIECLEVGEAYVIEKIEMPVSKYLTAPEFEGF